MSSAVYFKDIKPGIIHVASVFTVLLKEVSSLMLIFC